MPGRRYTAGTGYRYGFNGKENDNDVKGEGNQQDYGMRIYDTRLGKFLSVDPMMKTYPMLSSYQYAGNMPVWANDMDGGEPTWKNVWEGNANIIDWVNYSLSTYFDDSKPNELRGDVIAFNHSANPVGIVYYNGYTVLTGRDEHGNPASRINAAQNLVTGYILHRSIGVATTPNATVQLEKQLTSQTAAMGTNTSARAIMEDETTSAASGAKNSAGTTTQTLDKIGKRKELAESIFKAAGKNESEVTSLMNTVDFSRAVREKTLNIGDKIYRFERVNSKGGDMHFFTDAYGADAGATGVGFKSPDGYKLVTYEVKKATRVLETTIRNKGNKQLFSTTLKNNITKIAEE